MLIMRLIAGYCENNSNRVKHLENNNYRKLILVVNLSRCSFLNQFASQTVLLAGLHKSLNMVVCSQSRV